MSTFTTHDAKNVKISKATKIDEAGLEYSVITIGIYHGDTNGFAVDDVTIFSKGGELITLEIV